MAEDVRDGARTTKHRVPKLRHSRSSGTGSYSLATWTGAAYADNRALYLAIGAALVLAGSVAAALWFCR